jgi:hypothetical protein
LTQDNTGLFYDSINHRLGIGTTAPLSMFAIGLNSDTRINATGDVTARTFNGNTIATGSGTLNLQGYTLTIPNSGTLGSNAYTSTAFMTSVTGTANQINVAGTTDVILSLAPNLKITGDMTAKTFNGVTVATGTGTLTMGNNSLDIGTGGTLGSAAFTASSAYEVPLTFSTGLTRNTNTITNNLSLGVSGGQAVIGGTGVADILSLKGTTGNGTLTAPAIQAIVGNNGGTTALTILNNGNVGIGTTNPSVALEVNGQVKITGGSPGTGKFLRSTDNNGLADWYDITLGGLGGVGGSGAENFLSKWTSAGTSLTNSAIFDNGRVGIGTTAPLSMFAIGLNSDTRINATGDVTARTFNGNTIATGSGTLTLGSASLNIGDRKSVV